MRKLLLLDADVIIDLHALGLFGKINNAYDIYLTRNVFDEEDITFCSCDQAAIKLVSYMELEQKAISVERALRNAGHQAKKLYPRHLEKTFKKCVQEGKTLRIQFKKLV